MYRNKLTKFFDKMLQKDALPVLSENFCSAMDVMPQPVFIKDEKHRWIFLNKAMIRFMGVPVEERDNFLGKTDYDFHPPEEARVFWEHDDFVFKNGQDISEEKHSHLDGTERSIRTSKYMFYLKNNTKALIGFIQDITDHIGMEQALKYSKEKCQNILNVFPDKIFLLSDTSNISDSGSSPLEGDIDNYIPIGIQNLINPLIKKVLTTKIPESIEYPYYCNNKETYYEIRLIPLEETTVLAVLRDITEAKNAERLAKINSSYAEARIDLRPIMTVENADEIFKIFMDTVIQHFDINAVIYFEYLSDGFMPRFASGIREKRLAEFNFSKTDINTKNFVEKSLITNSTELKENFLDIEASDPFTKLAQTFNFSSGASLPLILKGKRTGAFVLLKNQTTTFFQEMIPFIENLKDETAAAILYCYNNKEIANSRKRNQKMEMLTELAGKLAHDFNNYLQAIVGFSELALEDLDEYPDNAKSLTKKTITSAKKARILVQQILSLSKKQRPTLIETDMTMELKSLLETSKSLVSDHCEISLVTPPELPKIMADPMQIEQALISIIINARESVNDKGNIIIESRLVNLTKNNPVLIEDMKPQNYIAISVSDNGNGIADQDQENIFEPFFTNKNKHTHSGLGLTTAYKIIRNHKGTIHLKRTSSKGTCFEVFLPVPEVVKDKTVKSGNCNKTVLIAEDDFLLRGLAEKSILRAGFNVLTANDGEDAVNIYKEKKDLIDATILDVIMPKLNGWQAYQKIIEINPNAKVLFMSGFDEEKLSHDLQCTIPEGSLLEKPFSSKTLIKLLSQD